MAITKCINSESKQYKPVLTDKLVLDAVPTVNSLNSVTSDAVARAIAGASGEVPQVTENDNGKVLKAVYDAGGPAVEWGEATVDQTYDATSTNAQSGVAVAQAIAAIPSDVTTASGHFDLEGSVPVTVNYTGTPHVVSEYITLTNSTTTTVGQALGILFPTQGNKSLGSDTANLVISETIHAGFVGAHYASDNTPPSPGPEITTSTGHITSGTINPQTIVLSGSNPAESFGYGNNVILLFNNLTDGETAETIIAKVSIQHWPAQTVDGYETTIPVLATPGSDAAGKVLTVTDTQGNYGWQPVPQELPTISTHAGEVLKVNAGGTAVEWGTAGANYTAGDGISISGQNEITVNIGTGLSINQGSTASMSLIADPSQVTSSHFGYKQLGRLTAEAVAAIKNNSAVKVTPLFDYQGVNHRSGAGTVFFTMAISGYDNSKAPTLSSGRLISSTNIGSYFTLVSGANYQIAANTQVTVDFSTLDTTQSNLTWSDIEANPTNYILSIISYTSDFMSYSYAKADLGTSAPQQAASTVAVTTPSNHSLEVSNPVPSYAAGDAGKVLAVNSGATGTEWVNAGSKVEVVNLPTTLASSADIASFCASVLDYVDQGKVVIGLISFTQFDIPQTYALLLKTVGRRTPDSADIVFETTSTTNGFGYGCTLEYSSSATSRVVYMEYVYTPTTQAPFDPWSA